MGDYVAPKLYSFQVPERPQIHRPLTSPCVIQGVEITNKIPAKLGSAPVPPADLASSFMITNVKPPPTQLQVLPTTCADEEDHGFPNDDLFGVLLGSAARPNKLPVTKPKTASVLPTSEDPFKAIRSKARAKVQNWLRESEDKRARGLNQIAKNYKK